VLNLTITRKSDRLPGMAARAHGLLSGVVSRAALETAADAEANTARVDTGAMQAGWFAVTPEGSNFEEVAERALSLRPEGTVVDKPALDREFTAGEEALIGNVMDYSIFNEMGTVHMDASPMLIPAMEAAEEPLTQAVKAAVEKAAR